MTFHMGPDGIRASSGCSLIILIALLVTQIAALVALMSR